MFKTFFLGSAFATLLICTPAQAQWNDNDGRRGGGSDGGYSRRDSDGGDYRRRGGGDDGGYRRHGGDYDNDYPHRRHGGVIVIPFPGGGTYGPGRRGGDDDYYPPRRRHGGDDYGAGYRDSDHDGIPDWRDKTPYGGRDTSSRRDRDSDYDGIPDYRDPTPYGGSGRDRDPYYNPGHRPPPTNRPPPDRPPTKTGGGTDGGSPPVMTGDCPNWMKENGKCPPDYGKTSDSSGSTGGHRPPGHRPPPDRPPPSSGGSEKWPDEKGGGNNPDAPWGSKENPGYGGKNQQQ